MADISLDADKMAALKKRFKSFREEQASRSASARADPEKQARLDAWKAKNRGKEKGRGLGD